MTQVECSPIELLPPELLSDVFSLLSSEQRHIANCRLVSRRWKKLSSPFLVTTVVIADSSGILQRLREILDHPYFSKHVTTLIWDASTYKSSLAKTYQAYRRACTGSAWKRQRSLISRRVRQSRTAAVKSLLEGVPETSVLAPQPEASVTLLGDDIDGPPSDMEQGDLAPDADIMTRGFAQYRSRFKDQTELRRRRLSLRYLHLAFKVFPRLRHFRFADFRSLARIGESLPELCIRLYGCSLPPSIFVTKTGQYRSTLFQCMRNLLVISPRLESITLGHGILNGSDTKHQAEMFPIRMNENYIPKDKKARKRLLSSIKCLDLYVTLVPKADQSGSKIPKSISKFLSHTQTSLRHLELTIKPYSEHDTLGNMTRESCANLPMTAFKLVLGSRHFQRLVSIVLDGWYFLLTELEDFLLTHKTTLRELHLLNCCFRDTDEFPVIDSFCNKLPSALSLTGVELYGLVTNGEPTAIVTGEEMQALSGFPRYQAFSASLVGDDGQIEYRIATDCFAKPHEIEAALLEGRANCLSSRLRVPKSEQQTVCPEEEDEIMPIRSGTIDPDLVDAFSFLDISEASHYDDETAGRAGQGKRRARLMSFVRGQSFFCFK